MDLREYQRKSLVNAEPSTVLDRALRLSRLLRFVAVEGAKLGYPLDELASLDMEEQGKE